MLPAQVRRSPFPLAGRISRLSVTQAVKPALLSTGLRNHRQPGDAPTLVSRRPTIAPRRETPRL